MYVFITSLVLFEPCEELVLVRLVLLLDDPSYLGPVCRFIGVTELTF